MACWWTVQRITWAMWLIRLRWKLSVWMIDAGMSIAPTGPSKCEVQYLLRQWDKCVKANAAAYGADHRRVKWRLGPVAVAEDDGAPV